MSTRINRTPSINQLLERLSRINPNKRRRPTCRTENLTILFRPSDYQASWIVFHLIERLIDDRPSSDVRREGGETGVSSEVFVQEETSEEEDDEFGDTDGLVHLAWERGVKGGLLNWFLWLRVFNRRIGGCGESVGSWAVMPIRPVAQFIGSRLTF